MHLLALAFGSVVGITLGMIGGGGAVVGVPLLVYGLSVGAHQAVGISLASVGVISLVGTVQRIQTRQAEVRTGLIFAATGAAGAPVGSWFGRLLPEHILLYLFSLLMVIVAGRMWRVASTNAGETREFRLRDAARGNGDSSDPEGPACQRKGGGKLVLTSRCALIMGVVGLSTGFLAGLFGIGGGLIIVPALVLFTGMKVHHAIATSLLAVTLIATSGVVSFLASGRHLPLELTGLFVAGGITGMILSTLIGRRFSGPRMQRAFAIAIVLIAGFIVAQTTWA
jgi:uncharacterized membrane protein YfcA